MRPRLSLSSMAMPVGMPKAMTYAPCYDLCLHIIGVVSTASAWSSLSAGRQSQSPYNFFSIWLLL